MQNLHIQIRPPWTNVFMNQHKFAVVPPWGNLLHTSVENSSLYRCWVYNRLGLEANLLNRSLIRFQICILCTFGCPVLGQRNFALYLVVIMLPSASTADNEMGFITLLLFQTR